ncbi:hypothetical protein BH11MYX3_BH11MYX3_30500 [soil metagenome]
MEAALQEGTTSSRYTILGRLAGGGMADIYLARSSSIAGVEKHVVLKRVLAEHGRDPQFAKMFRDEARLASQLQHPNIAQVLDVGILAGSYFFTMEYVHGKDVRAVLQQLSREKRSLPINLALTVAIGALAALHHAHEHTTAAGVPRRIVHRDVTPSNVMVSYEGAVKLLDFGVAKAAHRPEETKVGTIKGKIGYLSPEQCRTGPLDHRSDLFSLGIVLHEMLTGRRLFRNSSDFESMNAIINAPTPPPSGVRSGVSPALDAIVLKAMSKDPGERYATAAQMLEAIEELAETERHALSATALGRFLREVVGDHKEPWKELGSGSDGVITITGESIASLAPSNPVDLALARQLERAPALRAPRTDAETVADSLPLPAIPDLPPPLRSPPRWTLRVAIAVGGVALVLAAIWKLGDSATARAGSDPIQAAAVAARDPSVADAGVMVGTPPPDAAEARTVPTIASAVAANDWIGALQLCVATAAPTPEETTGCAIAACNARQRGVASDYHASAAGAAKTRIQRACSVNGIVLRQPTVARLPLPPAQPRVDPCEKDPLQCQK